jgi:polyisoprenoid-binding protein YceI
MLELTIINKKICFNFIFYLRFMKYFYFFLLFFFSQILLSQEIDINNSYIKFDCKYLQNALVEGIITGIKGKVMINQNNIQSSSADITIDISTLNTGYEKRDLALLKKDILDTVKYPLIYFKSLKFDSSVSDFMVTGNLKIKQTSKEISFPFTITEMPRKLIIRGNTTIDRFDFSIGENISTITAAREINIYIYLVLKIPE